MITLRDWLEQVYIEREVSALEGMTDEINWTELLINGIVPLNKKTMDDLIECCKIHGYYCDNCDEEIPFDSFRGLAPDIIATCPCCLKNLNALTGTKKS